MANRYALPVEGKNEKFVFDHLFIHHGIAEGRIEYRVKDGITILLDSLPQELRASELERLGIVVDADADLVTRWQSVRNRLASAGYVVPVEPDPNGTIVEFEDHPTVGIWLMPDNTLPGMLEHFVSFLGAADDPLWAIANDCLNEIPEDQRRFIPNHRIKAHIHTWLAWQPEPGTPLRVGDNQALSKRRRSTCTATDLLDS